MFANTTTATPWGIDARRVQVEVDVSNGLPQMQIVGLPEASVAESRERVRSAIRNSGFDVPPRVMVVNLAPAELKKEGNHADLAIAIALLAALGEIPDQALQGRLICGELGLDGTIRPVRGGLAIADLAARHGMRELLLPAANCGEAAALGNVAVIPLDSLSEAVAHLLGSTSIAPLEPAGLSWEPTEKAPDLAEVRGQEAAKRALEVAAAGGHNLLLIGPPGSGKTMLARRLPGILPPLTLGESIAVTKIHSLVAEQPPSRLLSQRPFRSPHPGISTVGMVGGGSKAHPGEASLAHAGVLLLDELPEFRRDTLEALRQPIEEGWVTVRRTRGRLHFPARFALLAAMNPCPCGHRGDARRPCRCSWSLVERYWSRISGPLLDRIDMHVEVPALTLRELRSPPAEGSAEVAARVLAAREIQQQRFGTDCSTPINAAMGPDAIRLHCRLQSDARQLVDRAFDHLHLSARALTRILKVGRTIADLDGSTEIRSSHAAEAIQYRSLERRKTLRPRRRIA